MRWHTCTLTKSHTVLCLRTLRERPAEMHLQRVFFLAGGISGHQVRVDGDIVSIREPHHVHTHEIEVSATGPVLLTDLSAAFCYARARMAPMVSLTPMEELLVARVLSQVSV